MVNKANVDSNKIQQIAIYDNEGEISEEMRYNRVTLIMTKNQQEITKEIKERVVTVFYKMTDLKQVKHKVKSKGFKKSKGIKLKLDPNRYEKCFFVNP